jgi:hypothetical protein
MIAALNPVFSETLWENKNSVGGRQLAQQLIIGKKKKVHDIHWKIDLNAAQSSGNHQLLFCWRIYDENVDVWENLFPEDTAYVIVREKIPKFLERFFHGHLPWIGITVSHPKTREELESWKYFQLGWYDKNSSWIEEVHNDPVDNRSAWQKFRDVPLPEKWEFSHFHFHYGTHMLTEHWRNILDEHAKLSWWKGGWEQVNQVYIDRLREIWKF